MCTVTNIHYHSVFVALDEYGKTGMIHISEVSPGRIRNIRDFVEEGKKVICKVLRINLEKGHIDLSLRRVNDHQRRQKVDQLKQEQVAEKIVEQYAKKHKLDVKKTYEEVGKQIFEKYDGLFPCFEEVSVGETNLENLGIAKEIADEITELIQQRIKPEIFTIAGDFSTLSYEPNGAEIIKEAIKKVRKIEGAVAIKYKGGGVFHMEVADTDPKKAEKMLEKITETVVSHMKDHNSEAAFVRQES